VQHHPVAHGSEPFGAGVGERPAALDRGVEPPARDRVGAGDHHQAVVAPGVEDGAQLAEHLIQPDGLGAVEGPAALREHLVLAEVGDLAADLREAGEAEVGQAEHGVGDAGAGRVHRAEAGLGCDAGGEGVGAAGDDQRPLPLQQEAEPRARAAGVV
jgi:hypothetical protein